MSDKNFSVDDILNEYPGKRGASAPPADFDLEAFLNEPARGAKKPTAPPPVKKESAAPQNAEPAIAAEIKEPADGSPKKSFVDVLNERKLPREEQTAKTPLKEQPAEPAPAKTGTENTIHIDERDLSKHVKLPESVPKIKPIKPTGNTELIEGLMRLKKERISKTGLVPPVARKSIQDIDLNLTDKILPNTAQIPDIDKELAREAGDLSELEARRRKKVADFVFIGEEEENEEDEDYTPEDNGLEDFESFEDAASIQSDISQLKKTLIIRLIILLICGVASAVLSMIGDLGIPVIGLLDRGVQPATYLFIQCVLGLVAAFSGYNVLACGLSKLCRFKADADSLCSVGVISSIVCSMLLLINTTPVMHDKAFVFIPVGIFGLVFNTIGKIMIVDRAERNFKFMAGDTEKYSVYNIQDETRAELFTKGTLKDFPVLATMKRTEFLTGFIRSSYSPDITDKFCRIAAPAAVVASLLAAALCALVSGSFGSDRFIIGAANFAAAASMICSFGVMLSTNLPLSRGSKKYLESSGVLLGYDGVEEFSDTNSVLLDVSSLFPQGMIKLSAIKVFSDTRIDEAIVEAASLSSQANSILKNMFFDIIAGKTEMLDPVESYIYEDSMGLCGWISNKRVLLGNRELMINHSISGLPTKAREKEYTKNGKQAIYLSVSGELSAMFVVELTAGIEISRWLRTLEKNGVYIILRSVDSIISISRLSELFGVSPEMFKLIPFRLNSAFDEQTDYVPRADGALACSGKFTSFAQLIVGVKRIRRTATLGLALQAAAAILGAVLMIILTLTGGLSVLNATTVLLYNLAWAGITALVQGIRRI